MLRLPYYHATFVSDAGIFVNIIDSNSHPFIWMKIELETFQRKWILVSWQEITDTEYHYYRSNID